MGCAAARAGGAGDGAGKREGAAGWLSPVGDGVSGLGYVDMFSDMFRAIDEGRPARETLYDGYLVNAHDGQVVIKRETLPDGRHKLILEDPTSGDFTDRVVAGG